jgi:glutamine synthetase
LAFATILEACLVGLRNKIEPPEAVEANIYHLSEREKKKQKIDAVPGSLAEALDYMEKSMVVKAALGEHIFNEFLQAKRQEWDSFRTFVSKWELDKYLTRYQNAKINKKDRLFYCRSNDSITYR